MQRPEYEVTIIGADNGITVQIGCKRLVFQEKDIDVFLADLKVYLTGGYKAQGELRRKYYQDETVDECEPTCAPPIA